jgi:hypothetical protein
MFRGAASVRTSAARRLLTVSAAAGALLAAGLGLAAPAVAEAGDSQTSIGVADPAAEAASCMGSGSAFYGTFAPQQRAFVAAFVIDSTQAEGSVPGSVYSFFAGEKEGGAIPAPCGTRIE